jgi:CBS domain-containing protein
MIIKGLTRSTAARMRIVEADASIGSAALAFADRRVGLLVVCGEGGRALGVISKSDLVRHLAGGGAGQTAVSAAMSRPIVSCAPEDDLHSTWQMMTARGLQNMPVLVNGERPLGVLDIRDALAALLDAEEYQEQMLVNYISGVGYH